MKVDNALTRNCVYTQSLCVLVVLTIRCVVFWNFWERKSREQMVILAFFPFYKNEGAGMYGVNV